jgi:hypothetical protein
MRNVPYYLWKIIDKMFEQVFFLPNLDWLWLASNPPNEMRLSCARETYTQQYAESGAANFNKNPACGVSLNRLLGRRF